MGGPWFDFIHLVGIAAGVLAVAAGCGGLYLLLGFRRTRRLALRMRLRAVHMGIGTAAVLLAVFHAVGRIIESGELPSQMDPTRLTTVAFVCVLASGVLRQYPPGPLQGQFTLLAWLHRITVAAALALLALHVYRELAMFVF
jgi:hypothetical protein